MSFDNSAFGEYVSDPRYDILKKHVKIDKDNKAYEIQFIAPATAKGSYAKTIIGTNVAPVSLVIGETCYNNDGSLHYIDVYLGSDFKANMQGTNLMLKYHCVQARRLEQAAGTAFIGTPISAAANANVGRSIPWNPLWFFNTIAIKGNQSQQPIEQYINTGQLHHITTAKFLTKYKRDALENNDMTFFTPCIESSFDLTTAVSTVSATRSVSWMGAFGAEATAYGAGDTGLIKTYVKMIPLSDIFESCETPAIWNNLNRYRLEFTFKLPDQIAVIGANGANASDVYVYVDEIKIMTDTCRMQAMQAQEMVSEKQAGTIENIASFQNFVIPMTYSATQQLVGTGQRDVQQVVIGFPAIGNVSNATNPIQYHSCQLSSLTLSYGNDMPLRSPLPLGGALANLNTPAYSLYKKFCGCDRSNIVPPAVSFLQYPFYHLYYIPIYTPSFPHKHENPADIRVDSGSAGTLNGNAVPVVMIIRKMAGIQIASDGTITTM